MKNGPNSRSVKFKEALCELHSVCVRSTARVFELYHKLELNVDNEYVCTARGEFTVQNDDDSKCSRGNLGKDENALPSQESPRGKSSETSVGSAKEIGFQPVLKLQEQDIELTNEQNSSGIPDGNNIAELPNMLHEDSIEIPEGLAKNDFHGSDEDNWIEVKFSGSLVMDSSGETVGSSQLQSLGDNENSEGTMDWQMGLSVEDDDGQTDSQDYLDSYNHTQTKGASFHQKLTTEKVDNTEISEKCFMKKGQDTEAKSEGNLSPLHKNNLARKAFYEAVVEIVNARPCSSITIRLLSLQDKSSVEIGEIQVYGLPVPAVTAGTETIGLSSGSSLFGSSFGGSLLAMLVPNMLQMSRVGLHQKRDELFPSSSIDSREMEMSESRLSVPELFTSSSQPLTSTTLSMEDVGASAGGYLSSGMTLAKRLPTDLLPYQKKYSHSVSSLHACPDKVAENVEMDENNLKDSMERPQAARHKTDYTREGKERQVEMGGTPASGGITGVDERLPDKLSELEVTDCCTQYCTKELKSNGVEEGIRERTSGEITLEHLLKRMDKLDALCMRIEAHVHEALTNMERRLRLVESRQMLPNLSVPTKIEDVALHSGLPSLPNLCSISLVSCPEIFSVSNCKHIHDMGMPSQSCTELHSSISMSNVFLGSLADSSVACAVSSSSVILPSHASHRVNSMGSEPKSMHGLSSVEEPLKACFHVSPANIILDESMLDQQVLSKEEIFLGNSQGADCTKEEISADSVISGNYICEHPTSAKRPAPSIEEALAAALSAFSASIGCPRIQATDPSAEAPCCSSELENGNINDKDVCDGDGIVFDAIEGLSSHQVETTAVCTAALCGPSEAGITYDKEVCYDDDIVFDSLEGVRYISQEGMDSVPYSSSQCVQDARHVLYRRSKIVDSQDGSTVDIKQACKLDTEIILNEKREIMLLEDKIEGRLCNNEMALSGKDSDSVCVIQDTSTCSLECSVLHTGQEQLQTLERPEELGCMEQWSKHTHLIIEEGHDLVADKCSAFIPVTGKCESDKLSIEGICSTLNNEARKDEASIESNKSKQSHDMLATSKLRTDLPSLLDVSFTVSDTGQMRMPLEALLYNSTPEQYRETVCLQESIDLGPLRNLSEPKRPHGLFFVEDEDLGDFILPSVSTLVDPVSTGNGEGQAMVSGAPPNFESLL